MTDPAGPITAAVRSGLFHRGVARWRTGRKVGRTIYAQHGDEPSDDDELIGVMDTPELARTAVLAVNTLNLFGPDLPSAEEVRGILGS